MKAPFTAKEYRQLLELVHLGMWTVTGYQGEDTAAAKRYYALDQKLMELATDAGCADLVESMDDGSLQPAPKLSEDERVRELVSPLHPADIADLFEQAPSDLRSDLAKSLADLLDGDVIAELNDHVREELIDTLDPREVADIASELETDDAVAIIEDMEEEDQRAVLRELSPDDRAAIEEALSYPEESAGRLMQRDLIAVPEHMTVGQVIDYLRDNQDLTTDFWEVFIVDPQHKPIGTAQLSWILRTPRNVGMADVMKREQTAAGYVGIPEFLEPVFSHGGAAAAHHGDAGVGEQPTGDGGGADGCDAEADDDPLVAGARGVDGDVAHGGDRCAHGVRRSRDLPAHARDASAREAATRGVNPAPTNRLSS